MTPSLRPAADFGRGMSIAILLSTPAWLVVARRWRKALGRDDIKPEEWGC